MEFEKIKDPDARRLITTIFYKSSFVILAVSYLLPFIFAFWFVKYGAWITVITSFFYLFCVKHLYTLYPRVEKKPGKMRHMLYFVSSCGVLCSLLGAASQTHYDITGIDYADLQPYYVHKFITMNNETALVDTVVQAPKNEVTRYSLMGTVFSGGICVLLTLFLTGTMIVLSNRLRRICKNAVKEFNEPQLVVYSQDEKHVRVDYEKMILTLGTEEIEISQIMEELTRNPGGVVCNGYNIMCLDFKKREHQM